MLVSDETRESTDACHCSVSSASEDIAPSVELTPRERGFINRIMHKYRDGQHQGKDLYRSLAIFSAMILSAHCIEQFVPTFWIPLLIVFPPAIWLFSRYRRFGIFRSCVLSKVTARLARYEQIAPVAGHDHNSTASHHHRHSI